MQAIRKGCKGQPGQGLSVNVIILCQPLSVSLSGPLSLSLSDWMMRRTGTRREDDQQRRAARG